MNAGAEFRELARSIFSMGPGVRPSEWCEGNIVLEGDETDDAGPLSLRLTPYMREVLDAVADPEVTDITLVFGSQTGKTLLLMLIMAYLIANDPSGIIYVMPNQDLARDTSADRWKPIVLSSGELKALMTQDADDFQNLKQRFMRSSVTWVGAHSTANLSSRQRRIVIQDETDKFPDATAKEARSIKLADARCSKFKDPKRLKSSTPSTEHGPIWLAYQASDMGTWQVPCPTCETVQALEWDACRWDPAAKDGDGWDMAKVQGSAAFICTKCGGRIETAKKTWCNSRGQWVKGRPEVRHHRGFRLPSWYAPWQTRSFGLVAREYLECKASFDMQFFDTNIAARPYVLVGDRVDHEGLSKRAENWGPWPAGVVVVTAGVDVQDDRLEVEIVGWGAGEENWSLEYHILRGNTERPEVWAELDRVLLQRRPLPIAAVGIDRGGHRAQAVYEFTRARAMRRVVALYGRSQSGCPVLGRPTRAGKLRALLFPVGTDTAKSRIFGMLKVEAAGPGYCHFPQGRDEEWYRQLVGEELRIRIEGGRRIAYFHPVRERNEGLDCRVYAYAALHMLPPGLVNRKRKGEAPAEEAGAGEAAAAGNAEGAKPQPETPPVGRRILRRPFRGRGWAGRF